jgi:hypothetical protein
MRMIDSLARARHRRGDVKTVNSRPLISPTRAAFACRQQRDGWLHSTILMCLIGVLAIGAQVRAETPQLVGPWAEEKASAFVEWCRSEDDRFVARIDLKKREVAVHEVPAEPVARSLGRLVWRFGIPDVSLEAGARFALLRDGRRLAVLPLDGSMNPRGDVALLVVDRDRAIVRVPKDHVSEPTARAARDTADHRYSQSDWIYYIAKVLRINLSTGNVDSLAAPMSPVVPVDQADWSRCGATFSSSAPPPRVVCADTGEPPALPRGVPHLRLCDHDMATIVGDANALAASHAEALHISITSFGLEYRLQVSIEPYVDVNASGDFAYSLTRPNRTAEGFADRSTLRRLRGRLEDAAEATVFGLADKSGLLSLEIVTPNESLYVIRRRYVDADLPGDNSLLAYRKRDFATPVRPPENVQRHVPG